MKNPEKMHLCPRLLGGGLIVLAFGFLGEAGAWAKVCEKTLGGDDQMRFVNPDVPGEVIKKIEVEADCTEVKITLKGVGKLPKAAMGHNWILTSDTWQVMDPIALKAGVKEDYVPQNDKRVIAATKLVGPGETTSTTFPTAKLEHGKEYDFFCGFPAHATAGMNGKFVVKKGAAAAH